MEVLTVANSDGIPPNFRQRNSQPAGLRRFEGKSGCVAPVLHRRLNHQTLRNQQPTPGATGRLKLRNIIKGLHRGIGPLPAQRGGKENGERYGLVFNQ